MEAVVTPAEMRAIDEDAPEPMEELIDRAGWAVARAAVDLLGRRYGSRVLVVAGKGNNGADGRAAADHLGRQGVRCTVVDAAMPDPAVDGTSFDLVIDAAYGTGFRGTYRLPETGSVPILAVDIPSGVDGLTGEADDGHPGATATVTFAALKPGLLLPPGRDLAGVVSVADIGLDCSRAAAWHLGPADVADRWPRPGSTSHKWQRAVWVIGGAPTMLGAPGLAASGAARAGAGYTAVSIPDREGGGPPLPIESVFRPVGREWSAPVLAERARFRSILIGPGLEPNDTNKREVAAVAAATGDQALVLDGGAIDAVATDPSILAGRTIPAVLTPHDGELARLLGRRPGPDRLAMAREAAAMLGAVVLSKGPTSVAAHPDGRVLVSTAGDQRLASAGTGDVLAGLVAAALAGGLEPLSAAGLAAELHGGAARLGTPRGFVAGDLPSLVGAYLSGGGA